MKPVKLFGYIDDTSVVPLCLILLQMSGWIKYFENGGKNMSFKIEDDIFYLKYNEIWNKIKELLGGIKFHSEPIYDGSYIKTKVKTFSEAIKTLFDGDKIPEENGKCKYKVKKREIKSFIDNKTDLDGDYESD